MPDQKERKRVTDGLARRGIGWSEIDHLEILVYQELVRWISIHTPTTELIEVMSSPDEAQSLYESFVNGQIDAQTYQSQKAITDKPQRKQKEHSAQALHSKRKIPHTRTRGGMD